MTDPSSLDPALLAGLRKALQGPLPLQAKGKVDGIFPPATAGKPLAERAKQEGLVEEITEKQSVTTTTKTGKQKVTVKAVSLGWRLTQAGRNCLAEADSPKPLLEALLKAVQKLDAAPKPPPPDSAAFAGAVHKATRECVGAIEKAFADLHTKLQTAFDGMQGAVVAAVPKPTGSADPRPVLDMIAAAVKRIDKPTGTPSEPVSPLSPPTIATAVAEPEVWQTTRTVFEELKRAAIRSGGLVKIPELTDAVLRSHPALTPGRFHELLLKWRGEDKLSLQVCSEKWLEPRGEEGIHSKHGLLFYVQLPQ